MDYFRAIRLQALRAVLGAGEPDPEYHLRYIFRWYSKAFHTPLHIVATLDEEEVLQAYFESHYEELDDNLRDQELKELLETDEERKKRLKQRDAERMEALEFAKFSELSTAPKKLEDVVPPPEPSPLVDPVFKTMNKTMTPASSLPKDKKPLKVEEDIEMKFVSSEDFERELAGGFGPAEKPKKP